MAHLGGSIVDVPVVFTHDQRYVFACCGNAVQMWSIATGGLVRLLQGHTDSITDAMLNPTNHLQLVTSSRDGTIRFWDYDAAACVKTLTSDKPVLRVLFPSSRPDSVFWLQEGKSAKHGRILRAQLSKLRSAECDIASAELVVKASGIRDISAHPDSDSIVLVRKKQLVCHLIGSGQTMTFEHSHNLHKVACAPSSPLIATGDSQGKIILWHNWESCESASDIITTTLHWHAHALTCLSFTSDGAFLLSGGREAVLVLWQVENGSKQFLPRLGAPIRHVKCGPQDVLYGISTTDNCIKIVEAGSAVCKRRIQGFAREPTGPVQAMYGAGIQVDPRSSLLVSNGGFGSLQFFNLRHNRHEFDHVVVDRNFISGVDGRDVAAPKVAHVAFSHGGECMMTVEVKEARLLASPARLKFWKFDSASNQYLCSTIVDAPHSGHISSVVAHPTENMFGTASLNGEFKLWATATVAALEREAWRCVACVSYKDLPCLAVAFSLDGSLFALAQDDTVTLWDTNTLAMRASIAVFAASKQRIKHVSFVAGTPDVVVSSNTAVAALSLTTRQVYWTANLKGTIHSMVASKTAPASSLNLDHDGQSALVYLTFGRPGSPPQVEAKRIHSRAIAQCFYPLEGQDDELIVLDDKLCFHTPFLEEHRHTHTRPRLAPLEEQEQEDVSRRLFRQVLGFNRRPSNDDSVSHAAAGISSAQRARAVHQAADLFDMPSHVLPPIESLLGDFVSLSMSQLLGKRGQPVSDSSTLDTTQDMDLSSDEEGETEAKVLYDTMEEAEDDQAAEPAARDLEMHASRDHLQPGAKNERVSVPITADERASLASFFATGRVVVADEPVLSLASLKSLAGEASPSKKAKKKKKQTSNGPTKQAHPSPTSKPSKKEASAEPSTSNGSADAIQVMQIDGLASDASTITTKVQRTRKTSQSFSEDEVVVINGVANGSHSTHETGNGSSGGTAVAMNGVHGANASESDSDGQSNRRTSSSKPTRTPAKGSAKKGKTPTRRRKTSA